MAYICTVSPELILSIDGIEDQTHFVLTSTANGELRVRSSILATGAWIAAPEVLRTPDAILVRFDTNSAPAYAQVYDDRVELLAAAPTLDQAAPLPLRATPAMMAAATPAASSVTQQLPPIAPAPAMPGLPARPSAPPMPSEPAMLTPVVPDLPVPTAPNSIAPTVPVPAPRMPVLADPTVAIPAAPERPWSGYTEAIPSQDRSTQVKEVLESVAARRRHPLLPFMIWGGITVLMLFLNGANTALNRSGNTSGAVYLAAILSTFWWFINGIQIFVPLFNRWRARLIRKAAGERGSLRETIVFTLAIGLVIFICACAPFSALFNSGARVNTLPPLVEVSLYFLICAALAYTLLGNIVNWRETGDTASAHLLDNLSQRADEVYASVIERMAARQLPKPYKAEFVQFEEQDLHSFEYQIVRQLNISYGRARVIFRATARGTDLYVRWESYVDFSMRRVTYVAALLSQIFIAPLEAISRTSLVELVATLFFSARDSTGGREISADTIPLGNLLLSLNWNYIPSYTIDELQALEVAVTRSAEEVLNRMTVEQGREERIHLAIDRSKSHYQRVF